MPKMFIDETYFQTTDKKIDVTSTYMMNEEGWGLVFKNQNDQI